MYINHHHKYLNRRIIRRFIENIIFDNLIYQIFIKYGRKLRFPYSNFEHDDAIYGFTFFLLDSLINSH